MACWFLTGGAKGRDDGWEDELVIYSPILPFCTWDPSIFSPLLATLTETVSLVPPGCNIRGVDAHRMWVGRNRGGTK